MLGAWGVLPVALVLLAVVTLSLARRLFAGARLDELLAGAVVLGMGAVHLMVGTLGQLGALGRGPLLGLLGTGALLLGRWAHRAPPLPRPRLGTAEVLVLGAIAAVGGLAVLAARVLPVWQWDAFGYHLPFVDFVLQSGGFAGVPRDVHYLSTYPHDVELWMVLVRAMLPDDRLVDLAQVPLGLGGAVLAAAVARRLGGSRALSMLAGAAWLCAPGVFLQLPTDYVDLGTASGLLGALYFLVLLPPTARNLLVGGVALGLFLGSKPSAPLATAFVGALAVARALGARQGWAVAGMAVLVLVLGGEMYLSMWLRHGNPVWPVAVHVGPWTLPGEERMESLLAAGGNPPRAEGPTLLERVTLSWLAVDAAPVFDMRLGGFGVLFLLALPAAVAGLVRRRGGWVAVALGASLLSPDPSNTRYVLAFAALVFAVATAELSRLGPRLQWVTLGVGLAVGGWQLERAWPGLVGDGPPFAALWAMTDEARRAALGPAGAPAEYTASWGLVREGESAAFDLDFELPGLLWSPELRYPVRFLPQERPSPEAGPEALPRWLEANRVRLLAVGPRHQGLIERRPAEWRKLFDCRAATCAVYQRR